MHRLAEGEGDDAALVRLEIGGDDIDHHARALGIHRRAVALAAALVARHIGIAVVLDGDRGGPFKVRGRGEGGAPGLAVGTAGQPGHGAAHHGQVSQLEVLHRLAEGEGDARDLVGHVQGGIHDVDHHARTLGVDTVTLGIGHGGAVARRVGGGDLGVNHLVPIGHQVATRHIDAESLVGQYLAGEGLAIDGQGDGVALFHVAAHGTGHGDVLLGLGRVDHVVRGDVAIQGDAGARGLGVDGDSVAAGAARVTGSIGVAAILHRHAGGAGETLSRGKGRGPHFRIAGALYQVADGATAHGQVGRGKADRHFAEGEGDARDLVGHVQGGIHDVDHHARTLGVDTVTLGIGHGGAVARRVGGGDLGVNHLVPIGHQVATRHIDAESLVGQYLAGEGLAIDGQGDGVALFHVAAHGTGHGDVLLGLGRVDHVVRGDVAIQGDAGARGLGVDGDSVAAGAARVTGSIGVAAILHRHAGGAGETLSRGKGRGPHFRIAGALYQVADGATAHGQVGRGKADRHFAEGEGDARDLVGHVQGGIHDVDHHARTLGVDTVTLGIGHGGAVARRVGGGDLGVNHLVPIGHQVATRHIDAESLVGQYLAGEGLAIDGQGDGVALFHVAAHGTGHGDVLLGLGRVDHVVRGDVAIQGDAGIRRRGVEQTGVITGISAVARCICDAGLDSQIAIRQPAQVCGGLVVAIGIGESGDGHLVTFDVRDDQGHGTARADIGGACDGSIGNIAAVHVIQCHSNASNGVHAAIVGGAAGIAGRIGHAGGYLIATIGQRCRHIHTEAAIRLHRGRQALLVAIGVGHHQGHSAARRGIGAARDGRGAVVAVVRGRYRDKGGGHIRQ